MWQWRKEWKLKGEEQQNLDASTGAAAVGKKARLQTVK